MARVLLVLLLPALLVVAANQTPSPVNRFALLIGQSDYRNLPPLRSPGQDVVILEKALTDLGFNVSVARNLDSEQLINGPVQKFVSSLPAGAVVCIHYAGYAASDTNQDSYLLPIDTRGVIRDSHGDVTVADGLSITGLLEDIAKTNPSLLLAWLDAPWSAPQLGRNGGIGALPRLIPASGSVSILYSNDPRTHSVASSSDWTVSPFTAAIDSALRVPGASLGQIRDQIIRDTVKLSGDRLIPSDAQYRALTPIVLRPPLPVETAGPHPLESKEVRRMKYIYLPAGKFWMGCIPSDSECKPDEKPARNVIISKGFWIAATETTVQAFRDFERATGLRKAGMTDTNEAGKLGKNPISKVAWKDAQAFCEWAGGRLPTEAEWEYAARGGKTATIYPWGDLITHDDANFAKSDKRSKDVYGTETSPTETFEPNGFGLFDLAGNVQEWTGDWYAPHDLLLVTNPVGPQSGLEKVVKGGSFNSNESGLRVSARSRQKPESKDNQTGFRCVLPLSLP